jgi:two-component system nitrogen regulation response regulator NtrX
MERVVILTSEAEDGQVVTAANLLSHLKDEVSGMNLTSTIADTQPGNVAMNAAGKNLRDARHEFEKDFILKTLKEQEWNISRTASVLGIERSHLHRKIKSYGIEVE